MFEVMLSNAKGIYVLVLSLLTVVLVLAMAVKPSVKSFVVSLGLPITVVSMVLWFLGGGFYADVWRYNKYGTWDANVPLPEWVDGASMGYLVAIILSAGWLWWLNRVSKVRKKNTSIFQILKLAS